MGFPSKWCRLSSESIHGLRLPVLVPKSACERVAAKGWAFHPDLKSHVFGVPFWLNGQPRTIKCVTILLKGKICNQLDSSCLFLRIRNPSPFYIQCSNGCLGCQLYDSCFSKTPSINKTVVRTLSGCSKRIPNPPPFLGGALV